MHTLDRQGWAAKILCAVTLFAALALCWQNANAAVTGATLSPAVKVNAGDCPIKVVFNGKITVNAPGIVNYIFTRSDGATDTIIKKLTFLAPGSKTVTDSWTLGGSKLPYYKGWEAIKIVGTAVESAHADFEVSCDPPLNSAKAAHGNTDWHIDTANEFLFGKDMANHNTAANFAPAGWSKTHIHVGQTNTSHFYNDKSRVATGDDTDATNGIDKSMLFFYAGHGNPTAWDALGTGGHQTSTLLGNITGGGQLRYFWQCSCEVFAHGPLVCSGGDCDYSAPENFDGAADSDAMRNVFERWGPAIGNDLRMACGVSTLAYCHAGNVNAIWDQFNNHGSSVAEAFIEGLGSDTVKPLCITRGGSDITKTPLYDETFTNRRNTSGNNYLHILYAGGTQTQSPGFVWKANMIPLKLLRVRLMPPSDPVEFKRRLVYVQKIEQFRDIQLLGGSAVVRRNVQSGALHLRAIGTPAAAKLNALKQEPVLRQNALEFVRNMGWIGNDIGVVRSRKMLTASMPVGGKSADITGGEKGTVVTISRRVRNGNQTLDVLGRGGRIDVVMGSDGAIQAASRIWRKAEVSQEEIAIKPYAQALEEAQGKLQVPRGKKHGANAYKLADWRFGYKEEAANVTQNELPVIFEFDFVPKNRAELITYPPQRIEVSAETR